MFIFSFVLVLVPSHWSVVFINRALSRLYFSQAMMLFDDGRCGFILGSGCFHPVPLACGLDKILCTGDSCLRRNPQYTAVGVRRICHRRWNRIGLF
jgi:hypothetical protein